MCTTRANRSFNLGEKSFGKALSQRTSKFQVLVCFEVSSCVLFIYPIDSITGPCCPGIHTPAGNSEHRTLHLTQGDAQCQQISLGLRRSRCMYDGMWRTRIEALRHGQWHIDTEAKAFPSMCNETKQVLPHLKQKISMQKHKTWFWCTVCSSHIHNGDNDSIFCSRRGVSLPIKNYFLRVIPFIISNPFSLLDSTLDPHPDPLFWHSFWHTIWKSFFLAYTLTFFLAFYLASILIYSDVLSGILSCISSDILSIWYIFGDSLWLRSGWEHSDPELAVEVRQENLCFEFASACSWGPAEEQADAGQLTFLTTLTWQVGKKSSKVCSQKKKK